MIEIIDADSCTSCNICVRVCPSNVFDIMAGAPPIIARQDDCQTCFMCEVYCPDDALYVHPNAEGPTGISAEEVSGLGLFGSYRRNIGWSKATQQLRASDMSYKFLGKG